MSDARRGLVAASVIVLGASLSACGTKEVSTVGVGAAGAAPGAPSPKASTFSDPATGVTCASTDQLAYTTFEKAVSATVTERTGRAAADKFLESRPGKPTKDGGRHKPALVPAKEVTTGERAKEQRYTRNGRTEMVISTLQQDNGQWDVESIVACDSYLTDNGFQLAGTS